MNEDIYVFYAGLLYAEYTYQDFIVDRLRWPQDLYNGAWIYIHKPVRYKRFGTDAGWWRADLTPALVEEVPKGLRTLLLLLT